MDDIDKMTGQANFNVPRALVLDELKLQGNSVGAVGGYFKYVGLTEEKGEDGKYLVHQFAQGETVSVVFLKVRRRLIESYEEGLKRWTSEHDTPDDDVALFGEDKERGNARTLREKYPGLRTEQVIYCRYKGKIIRLRVKGLSLQSFKDITTFFDYMKQLGKERFWTFATQLSPAEVTNEKGIKHWAINFARGKELSPEQIQEVRMNIQDIHANTTEIDAYYNKKAEHSETEVDEKLEYVTNDSVEYPEEEIDPDDIPF